MFRHGSAEVIYFYMINDLVLKKFLAFLFDWSGHIVIYILVQVAFKTFNKYNDYKEFVGS